MVLQTAGLFFALIASQPQLSHNLDRALSELAGDAKGQTPALSVAVVQDGNISYARGFGEASADATFRIGSVTKMFTAVSVMQLIERHKLALDEPVSTVLPDAPYADKITIRELLQHTSGLWNYGDAVLVDGAAAKPTTPKAILALVASHPLEFAPGSRYKYGNSEYVVLGQIVEKLSGVSLAAYERANLFRPSAMTHTSADPHVLPSVHGRSTLDGLEGVTYDPTWFYADGDATSTASDLARFDLALMNGQLLSPALFATMQSDSVPSGDGLRSGLGVFVLTQGPFTFVGHHGGLPDFAAENEMMLDRHLAFVVLSNSGAFVTARANREILATIDPASFATRPQPSEASRPEDPAITQRFHATLQSLLDGKIDRSQLSSQMDEALTPALLSTTSQQLSALGPIEKIVYVGTADASSGSIYLYDVTFGSGTTMRWTFAIDANGKVTAIGSRG